MRIDVQPILEQANDFDRQCMSMRGIEALYVVRYSNGVDLSVKFEAKDLENFQPNKTVSEMLKSWEEDIRRRYNTAKTALETGLHPTFTSFKMVEKTYPNGRKYTERADVETPKILDRYEKEHFKFEMTQLKERFGEIKFYKIC